MTKKSSRVAHLARSAQEIASELLWPTRCVCCDRPGCLLCETCERSLSYTDPLSACALCGAPFGRMQCCDCNAVSLSATGYKRPPFEQAVSATYLTDSTRRIITLYKDHHERRLAPIIASIMVRALPLSWYRYPALGIVYIPASKSAVKRRGFDHAREIACQISDMTQLKVFPCLQQLPKRDQRDLGRQDRLANMKASIAFKDGADFPETAILIDDVYTTGATLFAATEALLSGGVKRVFCLTFIRA